MHGFDGAFGMVWTIEDGRLAQRRVRFTARLMDGHLALTADALADATPVAIRTGPGFAAGRAARPATGP